MTQPKKNSTGIALIAPEDAVYEPWTSNFGEDGMGYIKMMSHPNRYITEARGEEYTSVEPSKNYIGSATAPADLEGWLNYSSGDIKPLIDAAIEERPTMIALERLGISETPIIKMISDPEIQDTRERETLFDNMSAKQWRKANRQLNRDERKLNRDIRRDSRIERAIADKFGDAYNPANRESMNRKFEAERERIEQMRKLLNNG